MDVSGISTSISSNSLQSPLTRHADIQPPDRGKSPIETRHEHQHGRRAQHGRSLGVFRQELQFALRARFDAKFSLAQQNYAQVQGPQTADDVAKEALAAAKQISDEAPAKAARAVISFRAKVHETASYVRENFGAQDDIADVDDAVAKVDDGLDSLEKQVANNRESTATALSVESRSKQRSTIRIRTQEGDVVKFDLRRYDKTSANDVSNSNGAESSSSTEVEVSSRSRLKFRVEGNLNDNELAAIKNVFAQAEEIANVFFDGDISAALNSAQGFEFDSEQLARVNLRFRLRQVTNVSYTEQVRAPEVASDVAPIATNKPVLRPAEPVLRPADIGQPAATPARGAPAQPIAVEETVPQPAIPTPTVETPVENVPVSDPPNVTTPPTIDTSSLSDFFELLSGFLRSVSEGFEGNSGSSSFSFHYSESFKLEILKSVIHTVAPAEATAAATNAELLIDGISNSATVEQADD